MRVVVSADRCIGSGLCALAAPDVFDQNEDDGVVRLLVDRPTANRHAVVREAVANCPASVISVQDEQ